MAVLKPVEVWDLCGEVGALREKANISKTLILSFLAGAFIALGGLLMITVIAGLPSSFGTFSKFIGGALFPIGLILVIFFGADLFTGNCLYYVAGLAQGKMRFRGVLKSGLLSYVGNFLGAIFIGYLATASGILTTEPWLSCIRKIAFVKSNLDFTQAFWRGVGCNWLVCLACWMALASDQMGGKILGIWVSIMAFVTMGFEHSIANMFFIPTGIIAGATITWQHFLLNNLLPVTLGNIVGGCFFVGTASALTHGGIHLYPSIVRILSHIPRIATTLFK